MCTVVAGTCVPTVLAVDDDPTILAAYARGFKGLGYDVVTARSLGAAIEHATRFDVAAAVIDLRVEDGDSTDAIPKIRALDPLMKIVVVSGYLSVATTVRVIRAGADHALLKPATCSEIAAIWRGERLDRDDTTPSLARAEWEHMMRVFSDCGGNVTHAARRLGLHRQNLQRRLRKNPPTT